MCYLVRLSNLRATYFKTVCVLFTRYLETYIPPERKASCVGLVCVTLPTFRVTDTNTSVSKNPHTPIASPTSVSLCLCYRPMQESNVNTSYLNKQIVILEDQGLPEEVFEKKNIYIWLRWPNFVLDLHRACHFHLACPLFPGVGYALWNIGLNLLPLGPTQPL